MAAVVAYTRTVLRTGVALTGATDGTNKTFSFPEKFIQGSTRVFHNGRRLNLSNGEYEEIESGGAGTGFNQVFIITFTPNTHSQIISDYILG